MNNFLWFFIVIKLLFKRNKKSFLKSNNKNIDDDKSLISVTSKGVNVELIKIILDIKATKTAPRIDQNA